MLHEILNENGSEIEKTRHGYAKDFSCHSDSKKQTTAGSMKNKRLAAYFHSFPPLGFYLTVPKPGSNVMASESLLRFNGLLGTSMSRHLGFVFSLEVSYRL